MIWIINMYNNFLCDNRGVSAWAIIIVLAFMVVAMIIAVWPQDEFLSDQSVPAHFRLYNSAKKQAETISERAKIEKWIIDNRLNEYGDPLDTFYAGGTPLFDETTGKIMDRFEYIKKNHSDEPWNR